MLINKEDISKLKIYGITKNDINDEIVYRQLNYSDGLFICKNVNLTGYSLSELKCISKNWA